jgi:hypothetical protein
MKVGAAKVDITPPLGLLLDGFGSRTNGATGVHDPLYAHAIVAEGSDGTTVALVATDLIGIDVRLQNLIAADVMRTTGIPRDRLQLAGTHTHSGPAFPEPAPTDAEQEVGRGIARAIEKAWAARREAVGAVGVGTVTGIGANRRPNGGPVDDRVTVARFDAADGTPIATLMNYGCHATTLGPNNLLYTADYPGVACAEVERIVGGVALFTTGPQGDVNPGGYSPEGSMVGVVVPWRTYESADRYGRAIGEVAVGVRGKLTPIVSDRVFATSRVAEFRRKALPDAATARAAADETIATARALEAGNLTWDATYHALVAAAYADMIAVQAADPGRDGPVQVRISALAVGPLLHMGVGGELFVSLGQRIRAALGEDTTCVAALCDGSLGYLPPADAFEVGGYEPNASFLAAGEGERLADAMIELGAAVPGA